MSPSVPPSCPPPDTSDALSLRLESLRHRLLSLRATAVALQSIDPPSPSLAPHSSPTRRLVKSSGVFPINKAARTQDQKRIHGETTPPAAPPRIARIDSPVTPAVPLTKLQSSETPPRSPPTQPTKPANSPTRTETPQSLQPPTSSTKSHTPSDTTRAPPSPIPPPPPPPPPPSQPAGAAGSGRGPPPPPPPLPASLRPPPPPPLHQSSADNAPDRMAAKLDALYSLCAQTLAAVQTGGGGGGGGRAVDLDIDMTPRIAPPEPVDASGQQVADARELMLAELRERLEGRRKAFDAEAEGSGASASGSGSGSD